MVFCESIYVVGDESDDIGRVDLSISNSCTDYKVFIGSNVDDLKIYSVTKSYPNGGGIYKKLGFYTNDKDGNTVQRTVPACFIQLYNEKRATSSSMKVDCADDADFVDLQKIFRTTKLRKSIDKNHVILTYHYKEPRFNLSSLGSK